MKKENKDDAESDDDFEDGKYVEEMENMEDDSWSPNGKEK